MRQLNLEGQVFGRLKVIYRAAQMSDKAIWWLCQCECGKEKEARGSDLNRGFIRSCGCMRKELPKERATHGGSSTRLYRIWQAMRDRCGNPDASRYAYYGGRGISVCAEWQDFAVFRNWALSNGYADDLSIDRHPDNDGNYEPSNCRWATQSQQVLNRRPIKLTEEDVRAIRSDQRPRAQIARDYGIAASNVSMVKNRKSWTHVL